MALEQLGIAISVRAPSTTDSSSFTQMGLAARRSAFEKIVEEAKKPVAAK